jgi:hypothetical protein
VTRRIKCTPMVIFRPVLLSLIHWFGHTTPLVCKMSKASQSSKCMVETWELTSSQGRILPTRHSQWQCGCMLQMCSELWRCYARQPIRAPEDPTCSILLPLVFLWCSGVVVHLYLHTDILNPVSAIRVCKNSGSILTPCLGQQQPRRCRNAQATLTPPERETPVNPSQSRIRLPQTASSRLTLSITTAQL